MRACFLIKLYQLLRIPQHFNTRTTVGHNDIKPLIDPVISVDEAHCVTTINICVADTNHFNQSFTNVYV